MSVRIYLHTDRVTSYASARERNYRSHCCAVMQLSHRCLSIVGTCRYRPVGLYKTNMILGTHFWKYIIEVSRYQQKVMVVIKYFSKIWALTCEGFMSKSLKPASTTFINHQGICSLQMSSIKITKHPFTQFGSIVLLCQSGCAHERHGSPELHFE